MLHNRSNMLLFLLVSTCFYLFLLVGMARFELTTPASRRHDSTHICYYIRVIMDFINYVNDMCNKSSPCQHTTHA